MRCSQRNRVGTDPLNRPLRDLNLLRHTSPHSAPYRCNELTTTPVVRVQRAGMEKGPDMYRGVSVSPQHGSFAPGVDPRPSDVEDLIAGRQRELPNFVRQAVFESLLRGEVHICGAAPGQDAFCDGRALAQNIFKAGLVSERGV